MAKGQVTFTDNPIKKDIGMKLIMPAVYQKKCPKSRLFFRPIYATVVVAKLFRKVARGVPLAVGPLGLGARRLRVFLLFFRRHFHLQ